MKTWLWSVVFAAPSGLSWTLPLHGVRPTS